MFINVG